MLIKNMLEDVGDELMNVNNPIPIPNVCSPLYPNVSDDADSLLLRLTRPFSERSSSGVSTTETIPPRPRTTSPTPARRPPTLRSGTRSSCRWTRKCSSRSFLYVPPPADHLPHDMIC